MEKLGQAEGDRADFPRLGNRFLLRGEQTGGRFALIEHEIPPRALAAPTHVHEREDEYSFVLSGRVGVQIGDEVAEAGPGEFVAKPRGIPHAFWNAGDEPARLLELISPAGFERYFEELVDAAAPDREQVAAIAARYELEMDFSSVPGLLQAHGLTFGPPA